MNKSTPDWISAEVQALIKPLQITPVKKITDNVSKFNIININMRWNPSDADSETYELKIVTFENGQPE